MTLTSAPAFILAVALVAAACVHRGVNVECPYDQSLHSAVASEFSSDTAAILGRVISVAGDALEGSVVTLQPGARRSETRSDGRFRFDSLAAGDYAVEVRHVGYGSVRERVRILSTGGARVTATLGRSVICLDEPRRR